MFLVIVLTVATLSDLAGIQTVGIVEGIGIGLGEIEPVFVSDAFGNVVGAGVALLLSFTNTVATQTDLAIIAAAVRVISVSVITFFI